MGAPLVEVLARYAEELERADGRLYPKGLSEDVRRQIVRMKKLRLSGPVRIHEATSVRGESTRRANADAEAWSIGIGSDHEEDRSSAG